MAVWSQRHLRLTLQSVQMPDHVCVYSHKALQSMRKVGVNGYLYIDDTTHLEAGRELVIGARPDGDFDCDPNLDYGW
jgi:hypothetical protein